MALRMTLTGISTGSEIFFREVNLVAPSPKIEQLRAALRDHDVAGFEVAMNDAGAVR